jgi:hypothetical protein
MVSEADVVVATLGASAGLAGLVLVFLGVVISRYDDSTPGASSRVRGKYATPAGWLFLTFVLSLATVAVSFAWLATHAGHTFYVAVVVLFPIQLLATVLASGYVTAGVVLKR